MQKLTCDECGTKFNCGAPPGKDHCWCMELPNLRESFDLAGKCVCPDRKDAWQGQGDGQGCKDACASVARPQSRLPRQAPTQVLLANR